VTAALAEASNHIGRRLVRRRPERGSVVLEFPLVLGLILIPFGLLILSFPTWVERQTAARDAAAESARYLLLNGEGGTRTPEQIVAQVEAGYDLPPGTLTISVPAVTALPAESMTVRVTVAIPAASLPIFGGIGEVDWTTEHTERMPDYGASQ